ncbi:MAG: polysaccharide deacetylase family protein [Chlorobiaceae bacterium]|nr:polysaccharide deacetylase family protein [Chlorobiaceae bacterium]
MSERLNNDGKAGNASTASTMMNYARGLATGAAMLLSLCRPAAAGASPVILSLDVEEPGDDRALRKLDLKVPATYFITGQFATEHPEAVAELSKRGNTIGSHSFSHPHFNRLTEQAARNEVVASRQLLESISGKPVTWFRAPFLEYDDRLMRTLRDAGYQGDSSDKDSWARQDTMYELPISNFEDSSLIASDYDMLDEEHFTGPQFRDALVRMYREKQKSGEPLVILLHPSVCVKEAGALHEFIDTVGKSGGSFCTVEGYLAGFRQHLPSRRAVWLDASTNGQAPEKIAKKVKELGATDVFLKATDGEGTRYFNRNSRTDRFGNMVAAFRAKGLKVHAWISALADRKAVEKHPAWGMIDKEGKRSARWISPVNPKAVEHLSGTIRTLVAGYRLDGICMDNLAYPDAGFDYTPAIIESYAKNRHLGHLPKLPELMNDEYTTWCQWRSTVVADLAGKLGKVAKRAGKGRIECSMIIPGNSAINYRTPETTGQHVGQLAQRIDMVVADIPLAGQEGRLDIIPLLALSLHNQAGGKPVMFRLNEITGPQPVSDEIRKGAAGQLSKGSDGISLLDTGDSVNTEKVKQVFAGSSSNH